MNKMIQAVRNFWNDESGAIAVEYALIVALMAGAIILACGTLSGGISTLFTQLVGLLTIAQ